MPFGATNAPRTFQRAMNGFFSHLNFVKIYLDDIMIISKNIIDHEKHLKVVFKICKDNNVSINFETSNSLREKVKYLGSDVNKYVIKPDIELVNKHEFKKFTNKKELQRLLGFINYLKPFIKNLSTRIGKLTSKLSGKHIN